MLHRAFRIDEFVMQLARGSIAFAALLVFAGSAAVDDPLASWNDDKLN